MIAGIFVAILLTVASAQSATYYVDGNLAGDCAGGSGTSYNVAGRNCSGSGGQIAWKTMQSANTKLNPGDTVYIRGGSYSVDESGGQGVSPAKSGTATARITYSNYNGEAVNFTGNANRTRAVNLNGKSYIRVTGLNFRNMFDFLIIDNGASYNEIDRCTFSGYRPRTDGIPVSWRGSTIYHNSTHNWIHHNTFSKYGAFTTSQDGGVLFELGIGTDSTDRSDYNTIEDNHMYQGGHHVLGINTGRYNVVRNNNVHNESWYNGPGCQGFENGVCGYRVVSMTGTPAYSGYELVEGNRISYGAQYGGPHLISGASGSGISVGTPYNIVRYNNLYANAIYGARLGASIAQDSSNNRLYNNTFFHNGYGADDDPQALPAYRTGLYFNSSSCSGMSNNVIKNNLFHDQWSRYYTKYRVIYGTSAVLACNTIQNNCEECTDDPMFVNPDIRNPASTTLPDLRLKSGSPVINKGTYLTQANGAATSSTRLVVDDARYFQDGTWGSSLTRTAGLMHADWIAVGNPENIVQISAVNYSTNTITLATAKTWADNAPVWLYKKSDGIRVLYGSAPDMGAHEYTGDTTTELPAPILRIVN